MSDLLMICPSRGRPANVARLLEAWHDTRSANSRLLVAVDEDDPELWGYQDLFRLFGLPAFEMVVGPRLRLGGTLNKLATERAPKHFAIGFLGDDHLPKTSAWDARFLDALRELGTGLVYGDDLLQRERLPTAVAMTSDIVRALGYFVPPGLTHMYLDNAWRVWGECLGRLSYLPDVVIEHIHPIAGKTAIDDGYAEVNSAEMYAKDGAEFQRYLSTALESDIDKLTALL